MYIFPGVYIVIRTGHKVLNKKAAIDNDLGTAVISNGEVSDPFPSWTKLG